MLYLRYVTKSYEVSVLLFHNMRRHSVLLSRNMRRHSVLLARNNNTFKIQIKARDIIV
jgi:hypothetical protein